MVTSTDIDMRIRMLTMLSSDIRRSAYRADSRPLHDIPTAIIHISQCMYILSKRSAPPRLRLRVSAYF